MKTDKLFREEKINNSKIVSVQPSAISGNIQAPASKSSMQRACAAALVRKAVSIIYNPGISNDDKAALQLISDLGALITNNTDGSLTINSVNFLLSDIKEINCGESGLGIRMFTPVIALHNHLITINGKGSLLNRPMDFFDEILPELNVQISSNNGRLPFQLKGPLQPRNIIIDGSLSSQFLTGLLFAYSSLHATGCSIQVRNLTSVPYIDLTLKVMKDFNLHTPENRNYEDFYFANEKHKAFEEVITYTVEGDWSGGAFLLVAGAIAGQVSVKGLNIHSAQADKAILNALKACNSNLLIQEDMITITQSPLKAFEFDATHCPDLFPPLVALAAYCEGDTHIKGVKRLAHKESNRALTLQNEFGKMNVQIHLNDDEMIVHGNRQLKGARVHSNHDHRIAMACAVAALKANGETVIEEGDAIKKSYPQFYSDMQQLGAVINYSS